MQQAQARNEEKRAFQAIADGLTATIRTNQREFDMTMKRMEHLATLSRRSIEAVTGGNSYPEITIGTNHADLTSVPLFAAIYKTKAAGSFTYSIQHSPQNFCTVESPVVVRGETGTIASNNSVLTQGTLHPDASHVNYYCITMQSKNGGFVEYLELRFDSTKHMWVYSYSILNQEHFVVAALPWR